MDINKLLEPLKNCPCGRDHSVGIKDVQIGHGMLEKAAEILNKNGFPKKILVTADSASIKAADGILEVLDKGGFQVKTHIYGIKKEAWMHDVEELEEVSADCDGIFSVGTGSVNDISRLTAARHDKPFAIFATAPSMDGFASNISPIIKDSFKESRVAREPMVIIADTRILAESPTELKAAGFGDVIGKLIASVDWQISHLVTGEYYCEKIAALVNEAVSELIRLAPMIPEKDETAAGAVMEALVLSGVSMALAGCSRPASGAEHMIAHLWEIQKIEKGELSDYHGKKVGVATVHINKVYRELAEIEEVFPEKEHIDWNEIQKAYGPKLAPSMMKMNENSVIDDIDPEHLKACWPKIREIIKNTLISDEELMTLMNTVHAATTIEEIGMSEEQYDIAMKYHAFMRNRVTLSRLRPMLKI